MMLQSVISNLMQFNPIPSPNRTSSLKRYSLPEGSQRCLLYGRHLCTEGDSRAPLVLYVLSYDIIYDVICDVICESSNQKPERLHHTHVTCASLLIGCAPLPLVLKLLPHPPVTPEPSESGLITLPVEVSGKTPFATHSPTLSSYVRVTICV